MNDLDKRDTVTAAIDKLVREGRVIRVNNPDGTITFKLVKAS